jgi:hypothetical protein
MLQFLQIALDGLKQMLQFEIVSNEHLLPSPTGGLTIALTQRNRAQALGATRNRSKREPMNGDREMIRTWGQRSSEPG